MEAATKGVQNENMAIREASILYNISFETLRKCINGSVIATWMQARSSHSIDRRRGGTFRIVFNTNGSTKVYKHKKKSAKGVLL